jgi:hypothetical protein
MLVGLIILEKTIDDFKIEYSVRMGWTISWHIIEKFDDKRTNKEVYRHSRLARQSQFVAAIGRETRRSSSG